MIRSELVRKISDTHPQIAPQAVEAALEAILNAIADSVAQGRRVEIRGFGSFKSQDRPARMGRNPRDGNPVPVAAKRILRFKASKYLLQQLNDEG